MKRCFLLLLLIASSVKLMAQFRIVGGSAVDISQRPYQAAVFVDGKFNGGGVIISSRYILTAAHVVNGYSTSRIMISVGHTNLNLDYNRLNVSKINVHEKYFKEFGIPYNDVAVICLSEPLNFNSNVQPISLSSDREYVTGLRAVVSGWGRINPDNYEQSLNQLQEATVTILSSDYQNVVAQPSSSTVLHGDSGGPLTIKQNGNDILIGIVSWGFPQDPQNTPSYYVNVGTFKDWILKNSILSDISLTGPTQICNSSGTFRINSLPADATVQWSEGTRWDALQLSHGQGTAQATYSTTGSGQGTVTAMVSLNGASTTLSQAVWAGAPSAEIDVSSDGIARASACLRIDPQTMHVESPVWQLWNPSQRVNFVEDDDGRCGRVRGAAGDWNISGTVTVRNGCGEDSERFSMSGTSQTDPCPRQLEQRGTGSNLTVMYTKPIDCPVWPIRGATAEPSVTIEVYDRMGRLLLRQRGEQAHLGSLRPGLYIVRARSDVEVATLTVVRE